jgi:hypothetical protein
VGLYVVFDLGGATLLPVDKIRLQQLAVWLVVVGLAVWVFAFIFIAHFIPIIPPSHDAEAVAQFYRDHSTGIRVMCMLLMFTGTFMMPFFGAISAQLRRIEGRNSPLAYTQIFGGVVAAALFCPSAVFWAVAAFRSGRTAQEILLLNDIGWFFFVMPGPFGIAQIGAIGLGILMDKRKNPLYPRWVGYGNLWMALLLVPSVFVALFHTGPFAWNGLIALWIPATFYFLWFACMTVCTLKAVRKPDEVLALDELPA